MTALCESPGCPAERRLSGLCELHYWKREAEDANRQLDAIFEQLGLHETGDMATRGAAVIACGLAGEADAERLRSGILAAMARVNENAEGGDCAGEMLGSLLYDLSALVGVQTGKSGVR